VSDSEQSQTEDLSDDEPRGRTDLVSVLYVVGGIPVIILFLVGLFSLVGACDQMNIMIPA
jgi:hypothetical protein